MITNHQHRSRITSHQSRITRTPEAQVAISRTLCVYVTAVLVLTSITGRSEENQPPCSDTGYNQFDFWLGEWDLSWGDDGKGINKITRILDQCVILENFDGGEAGQLRGLSVSTFNPGTGKWYQTWVDNNGTYLDFIGGMEGERMILTRTFMRDGREMMQRMIFRDIKADSLIWDWQRSADKGETWEDLWQIRYSRIK